MAIPDYLRRGMMIRYGDGLAVVEKFTEARSGEQKPTVHVTLRVVGQKGHVERTLDELGSIEEVPSEVRNMLYLHPAGDDHVFMDCETYEQYPLHKEGLGDATAFLVAENQYRVMMAAGDPVTLELPDAIVLSVVDTAPPEHQSSLASNVVKEARMESGIVIRVPLFIEQGDRVRVSTATREYLGKEK